MIFVTVSDLIVYIKSNVLADILQTTTSSLTQTGYTSTLLDMVERVAIDKVKGYTDHYYDIDNELKFKGLNRSGRLISFIIDIMLYELPARLTPTQIPDIRKERYHLSIKELSDISRGITPANWMVKQKNVEPSTQIRFGSDYPFSSKY